ncbi:phosphohydrolase [Polaribacter reichenbachii]|uniref:Phosphohydrolase n=1 Tax=Polaribacter reichenbachii TaxID=996801 RepID=A0A1B8U6C8_9FLAO|nr:Pycsar system effector family protein [Polaribacter reichenbachii]APZ46212.1 phosphohydrolase [Polaribacter reichenbachii]AUC20074.1 phosphohydrolase [Polaribacter reichenbachii]OBY67378.1 phosphohydrolase [Polaribacter reichenbachii]
MSELASKAELYVLNFLSKNLDKKFVYHNISHTQRVVENTTEICENIEITEEEREDVLLAAWFHDTGFVKGAENHEDESVKNAVNWLQDNGVNSQRIETISNVILATKMGSEPTNKLEEIIVDADCAHLASKNFLDYTALLRKEWELTGKRKISEIDWIADNIEFFTITQKFYTDYALKNWSKRKAKNLAKLIKSQKEIADNTKKFNQKQQALDIKKNKSDVPERGVETMFRVALRNHITLSDIADTKANILLSVNAIIISMALSTLIPKLDNPSNDYLLIPSIIFILFTVVSMVLSILATRPNVTQGKFTKEDVANKKVNLLFFGNFHQMKLEEFEWGIQEMMNDKEYLYGSLTKDLYFLGLVLNRKYNLLRTTYTVFMIGIIVSVIAFSIAFAMQGTSPHTL